MYDMNYGGKELPGEFQNAHLAFSNGTDGYTTIPNGLFCTLGGKNIQNRHEKDQYQHEHPYTTDVYVSGLPTCFAISKPPENVNELYKLLTV